MKDMILYHGSRGGLDGKIAPISRARTDFGKGFYLGTNDLQAKGLICNEEDAVFYTVKLKLSEIPEERILTLTGKDWLYTVLANRKKVPQFNELKIAEEYLDLMEQYDVIIGPIADDRMNTAIKRFIENGLTDKGLEACLKSVNYGYQFVLKTPFACDKIEIISSYELSEKEKEDIFAYNKKLKEDGDEVIRQITTDYLRDGLYLAEMIEEERNREVCFQEEYNEQER